MKTIHKVGLGVAAGTLAVGGMAGATLAQADPTVSLEASNDGLVPYRSAHLAGALSEKVIVSGHSVQETPAAILEIRRILHRDVKETAASKR